MGMGLRRAYDRWITGWLWALLSLSSCQQVTVPEAVTPTANPGPEIRVRPSPPTTWPGTSPMPTRAANSPTVQASPGTNDSDSDQDTDVTGTEAVITAQDANAEVNVRSQPSQQSEAIGQGQVGDAVVLGRSEVAADDHLWYHVTFPTTQTIGWIRSDFLIVEAAPLSVITDTASRSPDTLKVSLDEHCGGPSTIQAYFVTASFISYLCQTRGDLRYVSQEKGTRHLVISDHVRAAGGGYIVVNGNYEYRLDSHTLTVVRFDDAGEEHTVLAESVAHAERY